MRRASLLALPALAGCWPYIQGSWEDYHLPEEVQIVGGVRHVEPVGGSWEEDADRSEAWWGWLDQASASISGLDWVAASPGCTLAAPDTEALDALLGDPGADSSLLLSEDERLLPLAWDPAASVFSTEELPEETWEPGTSYDLVTLETENQGKIGVHGLLTLPPAPALVSSIDFTGDTWPKGDIADLDFTWDEAEAADGDWFLIEAQALDDAGDPLETVTCLTQLGRGALAMNAEVFTTTRAAGWRVRYGTLTLTRARVVGREVASSVSAASLQQGYLERD